MVPVIDRRQVGGREYGDVADVLQRRGMAQHRRLDQHVGDVVPAREVLGQGFHQPAGLDGEDADAVLAEFGRQLPAQGVDGGERDDEAADRVVRTGFRRRRRRT